MTPAQVAHIMPPLPKPLTLSRGDEDGAIQLGYTAEQMQAYARAAVEAALRDAPQAEGWVMVPAEIVDRFPEINTSNYDHDDACALNAWGVELVLAARPSAPTAVEPDEPLKWCSYCGEGVTTFCRGKQSPDWDYKCPVLNLPARASKGTP